MAGKKQALGKKLEDLFGDIEAKIPITGSGETKRGAETTEKTTVMAGKAVIEVDIDEIKPNSNQPRQEIDPEGLDDLAASIEAHGVISPVLLQKAKTGYELVYGERRWRAARKAGLKHIPATVREVTEEEKELFAIIENTQRENLNAIEEGTAYRGIINKYGMTQEGLAKIVGKSRSHVANTLRALGMQKEIVEMIRQGLLTLGHANALGAVKDEKQQLDLAEQIVKGGLSVREAEKRAARAEKKPSASGGGKPKTDEIRMVEQELTTATGIRVRINGDDRKGNVELRYLDRQGLEEIIDLLRKAGIGKK